MPRPDHDTPLLRNKHYRADSVFTPEGLVREARRQRALARTPVPSVCLLDPDGDLYRRLDRSGSAECPGWACYHTRMLETPVAGETIGVVGCAVGASFAVLVAEQFFACGGELLISITSAGQISGLHPPPYFVLIDRALRDEGTSHHYAPAAPYAALTDRMAALSNAIEPGHPTIVRGGAWTTDAPFRETAEAIAYARSEGLLAVEMEAAALYTFACARQRDVICFAHVTNQMATVANDFEKGAEDGCAAMVSLTARVVGAWRRWRDENP